MNHFPVTLFRVTMELVHNYVQFRIFWYILVFWDTTILYYLNELLPGLPKLVLTHTYLEHKIVFPLKPHLLYCALEYHLDLDNPLKSWTGTFLTGSNTPGPLDITNYVKVLQGCNPVLVTNWKGTGGPNHERPLWWKLPKAKFNNPLPHINTTETHTNRVSSLQGWNTKAMFSSYVPSA